MRIPVSISVFYHHRPSHVSSAIVKSNFHVHEHDILKIEGGVSIRSWVILAQSACGKHSHNLLGVVWQWRSLFPFEMVGDTVKIFNVVSAGLPCPVGSNANTSKLRHIQCGKCSC